MPAELDDLVAPPPAPDFRERLWERAAERERVVARRWRAAAIAAIAVAAGSLSAASVFAFGSAGAAGARTFDETRSCPVAVQGGIPVAMLSAHAGLTERNNGQMFTMVGLAGLSDHNGHTLGAIAGAAHGYGWGDQLCSKTKPIPLARAGLPLYGVFKQGERGLGSFDNGAACWVGSRITVRVHAVLDGNDKPIAGTLALRSGKKLRPIAYVEWQPRRVAVYFGDDCHY